MMIQFGSSIYMILGTKELVDDERLWREEFIVPGLCDISAGTNAAGSLTKWYRDHIFSDCVKLETENGIDAYQTMMGWSGRYSTRKRRTYHIAIFCR